MIKKKKKKNYIDKNKIKIKKQTNKQTKKLKEYQYKNR